MPDLVIDFARILMVSNIFIITINNKIMKRKIKKNLLNVLEVMSALMFLVGIISDVLKLEYKFSTAEIVTYASIVAFCELIRFFKAKAVKRKYKNDARVNEKYYGSRVFTWGLLALYWLLQNQESTVIIMLEGFVVVGLAVGLFLMFKHRSPVRMKFKAK